MRSVALLILLHFSFVSSAQLLVKEIPNSRAAIQGEYTLNADPVKNTLPFWDDFSVTEEGAPDANRIWGSDTTKQWNSSLSVGVYVNATLAINPPTYRVVTFDGLDALGQVYGDSQGLTDQLYSDTLDLGSFTEADDIYLSFFWQAGGNVEKPDEGDSIRLQFYNPSADTANGNPWENLWSVEGSDDLSTTIFTQEFFKIEQRFLTGSAIFRFQSFGDEDGPFDAWHLDYIYLDKNRTEEEIVENGYDDAAFTNEVSSFLSPYSSMPVHQFLLSSTSIANQQTSLSYLNQLDPDPITEDSVLNLYGAEITYSIEVLNNNEFLVNDQEKSAGILSNSSNFIDLTLGLTDQNNPLLLSEQDFSSLAQFDSVVLESTAFLLPNRVGSSILDEEGIIDLTINDTIRNQYLLHDYYAFDDGTAEYAVGVNERGDQVGVQFWVEEPDTLTHIEIYFPNIAPSSNDETLTLRVFKNLDDAFSLRSEPVIIATASAINEFTRYELRRPLIVSDTFYVTYEQDANQYIGVGFDRSNPQAAPYIFENIADEWVRNERIQGALMIRAVFERVADFTLGVELERTAPVIYPNPSTGLIHISSDYEKVELRDLSGKLLRSEQMSEFHDFSRYPPGMYLLTVVDGSTSFTQKIVLK